MQERWQEIRNIHIEWADAYRIFGGVVLVLFGIWIGGYLFSENGFMYSEDGYRTNLYTEFIGITVTVFVIDYLNRRRDQINREEEYKDRLTYEAKSSINEVAISSLEKLKYHYWLEGANGVLKGGVVNGAHWFKANLAGANLETSQLHNVNMQSANLLHANLHKIRTYRINLKSATLDHANLSHAELQTVNFENSSLRHVNMAYALLGITHTIFNLEFTKGLTELAWTMDWENYKSNEFAHIVSPSAANLRKVNMSHANLYKAFVRGANLSESNLYGANLERANLASANLKGVNLTESNLKGAVLTNALFDEHTALPDSNLFDEHYWTSETDMTRFTDPNHPNFWEPEWVKAQRANQ